MQLKDKISVLVSISAIIISLIATVRGEFRANIEADRTIRSQLTVVLESMMDINLEAGKIQSESNSKDPNYVLFSTNVLNQQNAFLLSQAMYLSEQIPDLVTPVEIITIAHAQLQIGNPILAEALYSKAIDVSKTEYESITALRVRANYLFQNRRFKEARNDYERALGLLNNNDDMSSWTHGTTYLQWANNEKFIGGSTSRATPLYESAMNEFDKIDNQALKAQNLYMASNAKNTPIQKGMPSQANSADAKSRAAD